ncbi:MAG: phosphoribosylanthranilate isomerase [Gammaproteobacteria bacterium]|nr:MAG: phosphoribosylanthranilate isomerase [Gammaproteobacteria bacterium]
MRTRVKICGITRCEDAQLVVDAGVDAVGLVFYEKSPRFVNAEMAAEISQAIPAFVSRVALFKDANTQMIKTILQTVAIDLIQFHGSETAEFCEQFNRPYIKALGMRGVELNQEFLSASVAKYSSAKALLLDGHAPGEAGGTGESLNWSSMAAVIASVNIPIVLAGGLNPDNVKMAIEQVHPYGVDVSSGVESSPGIKDKTKVTTFMEQVAI